MSLKAPLFREITDKDIESRDVWLTTRFSFYKKVVYKKVVLHRPKPEESFSTVRKKLKKFWKTFVSWTKLFNSEWYVHSWSASAVVYGKKWWYF